MKRTQETIGPDEFKNRFAELRTLVEKLILLEPEGYFKRSLRNMIDWATAELVKEPPESPLLTFGVVLGILNDEKEFGNLLTTATAPEKEALTELKNDLPLLHATCKSMKWPKPKHN